VIFTSLMRGAVRVGHMGGGRPDPGRYGAALSPIVQRIPRVLPALTARGRPGRTVWRAEGVPLIDSEESPQRHGTRQEQRFRCSEVVVRGGVEPPTFRFSVVGILWGRENANAQPGTQCDSDG